MKSTRYTLKGGSSLIDVLVATGIIATVFVGILGFYTLILQMITEQKARLGATALSTETLEQIRGMDYNDVATVGGIPDGPIPQNETVSFNGVEYNRRTLIKYVDSPEDGFDTADSNGITSDYKQVKVELSWNSRTGTRYYTAATNVSPPGIESTAGGGSIRVTAIDANANPVENAEVTIINNTLSSPVNVTSFTNAGGQVLFPGSEASGDYEITVTKSGFSTSQTYAADAVLTNPNPTHLNVLTGQTTSAGFEIDELSTLELTTYEPSATETWSDSLDDTSAIAVLDRAVHITDHVELAESSPGVYEFFGLVESETIAPTDLLGWNEIRFTESELANTSVKIQVLHFDGSSWSMITDTDLSGNSAGYDTSPVDISMLEVDDYPELRLQALLETSDGLATPSLLDWEIEYEYGPVPLPSVTLSMRGNKTIGLNSAGEPVYKYNSNITTDGSGELTLADVEWDTYTFSDPSDTYRISEACESNPFPLVPGVTESLDLILSPHSPHTLRISVVDNSGVPVEEALVDLDRGSTDVGEFETSECGQVFFGGLVDATNYEITVSKAGYTTSSQSNVSVGGESVVKVVLLP